MFINPAGLAPIRHVALGASAEASVDDSRLGVAAGAVRLGRFTLGFGAVGLDLRGDSILIPDSTFAGGVARGPNVSAYNVMGAGAVAYRRGMISLGASVKGLREYISDGGPNAYGVTGVTGNVGLGLAFFDIAAFGFVVENVGGSLTGNGRSYGLPKTLRGAFTLNFVDPQGTIRLLTTLEWVRPTGGDAYWVMATETGTVLRGFGVLGRAGFTAGRGVTDRRDASFGAGIVVRSLRFDYATQGYRGITKRSHRLGMRIVF